MSEQQPTPEQRITRFIEVLRDMDRQQQETDDHGGREIAWYYYREQVEDALGLERGALDAGEAPLTARSGASGGTRQVSDQPARHTSVADGQRRPPDTERTTITTAQAQTATASAVTASVTAIDDSAATSSGPK